MHIDSELLEGCVQGDEKSQFDLYKKCYAVLYKVCQRYANDEDQISVLLNSSYLKIIRGLPNYRYDESLPFSAWIRRIAINTAIDSHRKEKKYKEAISYPDPGKSNHVEIHVDYNKADLMFDADQLLQLIRNLPPMTQKVFNLFAIDGFSHREVGTMLSISIGTSKWHLSEARKQLKIQLESDMKSEQSILMRRKTTERRFYKI